MPARSTEGYPVPAGRKERPTVTVVPQHDTEVTNDSGVIREDANGFVAWFRGQWADDGRSSAPRRPSPDLHGHTPKDHAALLAAGIDPEGTQARDRKVKCWDCPTLTANLAGNCDRHYLPPKRARAEAVAS